MYICENCDGKAQKQKYRYREGRLRLCYSCRTSREKKARENNGKKRKGLRKIKDLLLVERGKRCEVCGLETGNLIAHHKNRIMDGGGNNKSNLMLVCTDCHNYLHTAGTKA